MKHLITQFGYVVSQYLCYMQKGKNTIPVYDICSLNGTSRLQGEIIAQPFADYLEAHPHLHHSHGHSFYHFVLFTKGGGWHTVDFERIKVKEGQIYFMVPGQVHSWDFEGEMDGYIVNFSEDLFRPFLSDSNYLDQFSFLSGVVKESVRTLTGKTLVKATGLLKDIIAETQSQEVFSADMARMGLLELFILVARNTATVKDAKAQPNHLTLHQFRKLVNRYYNQYRLPKEYAAMLYITANHLNALCRDLLGKPAGEVIRDRIILEAKRLLVNADVSISEIAYQLNFKDNSYFTKFFKKYTGTTPEEFKQNLELTRTKK